MFNILAFNRYYVIKLEIFRKKKNKTLEQSTCSGTKKDFNQNLNKKENQQNQLFKSTFLTKKKKVTFNYYQERYA